MKHVNRNANGSRRARSKSRWARRVRIGLVLGCTLGVIPAGIAVFHEMKPRTSARRGVAVAGQLPMNCGPHFPAAKPGYGKRDVTRINVSTDSTANAVGPSHDDPGPGWGLSLGSIVIRCLLEDTSAAIHIDGRPRDSTWTETYWESPVSVYEFLTGEPYGVNDYVLENTVQSFRLDNCIEGRLETIGDGLASEITVFDAGPPRRRRWITDAAVRHLNCGRNPETARLDDIIYAATTGETTIETPGVMAFPCRCERRPPRGSNVFRLARNTKNRQ